MRFLLVVATSVALGATLCAGCSTSQGSVTLPSSSGEGQQPAGHSIGLLGQQVSSALTKVPKQLSQLRVLELEVAGKFHGPAMHDSLVEELKYFRNHPEQRKIKVDKKRKAQLGLWTAMNFDNYVLGTTANGKTAVAAFNTETASTPGISPITVKVDHSSNVWVTNQYEFGQSVPVTQEWNPTGTKLLGAYTGGCPVEPPGYTCQQFYSEPGGLDSAVSSTTIFQSIEYVNTQACPTSGSCLTFTGGAIEYWPIGNPSATPKIIELEPANPVVEMGYMDVDSSGNLWIDYVNASGGYGIAEITNPTSENPTVTTVGALDFWGGIYVTGTGTVTALDQATRDVYSCTPSGCTKYLGPVGVIGDPVSGGFNKTDSKAAYGDCEFYTDEIGSVSDNSWTLGHSPYEVGCLDGAAYTPSDK